MAGFTPDQLQAFNQFRNLQGTAQPYYDQSQALFNRSAAPISAGQISSYMNPYASSVLANLRESQGQQMLDLTGRATQMAGGVGADRIPVAQGELARQQGLATGQTLSGIYGSALSAAQQDAQRQQAAAYGIGNLGGAAQNALMQGAQGLYGMGNIQQQLAQAQMNAPYQNTLAQIAYPYQQAQYLAGITGQEAPFMGGTTSTAQAGTGASYGTSVGNTYGYGTKTPAQPSLWSQLLGAGTAGLGTYGALNQAGAFDDLSGGSASNPLAMAGSQPLTAYDYGARGGRVGYADGGETGNPSWMTADPTIPVQSLHASQVQQPRIGSLDLVMRPMPGPSPLPSDSSSSGGSGSSIGSDIASAAKFATALIPFLAQGGAVGTTPYQGYADGGDTFDERFDTSGFGEMPRAEALAHYMRQPATYFKPAYATDPQLLPEQSRSVAAAAPPTTRFTVNAQPQDVINPGDPHRLPSVRADGSPIVPPDQMRADETSEAAGPKATGLRALSPAAADIAEQNLASYRPIGNQDLPYKDLDSTSDVSRGFAKSPWLALINAGAKMMAGTSPFAGVNIGEGLQAGTETLGKQREASREEENVNQRAKQKLTPAQAGTLEQSQSTLKLQKLYEDPIDGTTLYMNHSTGKIEKYGRNGQVPITPADHAIAASKGVQVASADDIGVGAGMPYQSPPANTDLAPPGGTIVSADPQAMIASTPIKAEPNPDIAKYVGGVGQAKSGRQDALREKKGWDDQSKGADKVQYRTMEMKRDLDTIMAYVNKKPNGAFEKALQLAIKPGPGAESGVSIAALASKFGVGVPPEVLAAAQTWQKNATLAGFAGIVGEGLSAREAQPIIKASMSAVANLGLPEASNRALIASTYQIAQRAKDQAAFLSDYILKNGGQSANWKAEFEKSHPMGNYVARAVISSLPPEQRAKLNANVQELRQVRDQYMAAEKSGNKTDMIRIRPMYNYAKNKFNERFGGIADYFAFGQVM